MPRLFPTKCLVCGKSFHPKRNAALYCSNVHRQRAYRARAFTPAKAPIHDLRNHRQLTTLQAQSNRRRQADTRARNKTPKRQPNNAPAKAKK